MALIGKPGGLLKPHVSVCITAYNHENYIAQAVDSVLMQQTDFSFEILIGEDQSSDRTREILVEYQLRHPEKIRLFLHDYPADYARVNGMKNFVHNIRHAHGTYIALLDGDDYWIDRYKLQKQVRLLEDNPSFSTCFHNVLIKDEMAEENDRIADQPGLQRVHTLEDIVKGNFIYTCSVLFRRDRGLRFPRWFLNCPIGDWPLHVINARNGDIGYIPDVMGVYRINKKNLWSSRSVLERRQTCYGIIGTLDQFLRFKYHDVIEKRKLEMLLAMLSSAIELRDERSTDEFLERVRGNRCATNGDLWKLLNLVGRDALAADDAATRRIAAKIFSFVLHGIRIDELGAEDGARYVFLISLLIARKKGAREDAGIARQASSFVKKFGNSGFIKRAWELHGGNQKREAVRILDYLEIGAMTPDERESCFLLLSRMAVENRGRAGAGIIARHLERLAERFGTSYRIRLLRIYCDHRQYGKCLGYLGKMDLSEIAPADVESYFRLLSSMLTGMPGRSGERDIVNRVERLAVRFGAAYRMRLLRDCYAKKRYGTCSRYLADLRADEIAAADRADYHLIRYYARKHENKDPGDIAAVARSAIQCLVKKESISNLDAYRLASLYSDLKEYRKAIRWFHVVIRYNENRRLLAGSYFHLGAIYHQIGNTGRSAGFLRKCLQLDTTYKAADSLLRHISRSNAGEKK